MKAIGIFKPKAGSNAKPFQVVSAKWNDEFGVIVGEEISGAEYAIMPTLWEFHKYPIEQELSTREDLFVELTRIIAECAGDVSVSDALEIAKSILDAGFTKD